MRTVKRFLAAFAMPLVACTLATITMFFVPPDAAYKDYFDLRTLTCLFCTLAVVVAFKNVSFFRWLASVIVRRFQTVRSAVIALVFITYFGSMIMANDMALITFLPLGFLVLASCKMQRYMAFTFIMQNIAANLGGMLTPFGNPQNLYLFSYYHFPTAEFFATMALPFACAFVLILASCFFVKPLKIEVYSPAVNRPPLWRILVYSALFILSVLIVFRLVPYLWGLVAVTVALLVLDYKSLLHVDYKLLLTFCAFFVFSGNLARIPAVGNFLGNLVQKSPLLVGIASCQFISNVPSAVLLSRFTTMKNSLLVAVNLGGLGTPIASLASLITLSEYGATGAGSVKKYLLLFLAVNFGFLIVLTAISYFGLAVIL